MTVRPPAVLEPADAVAEPSPAPGRERALDPRPASGHGLFRSRGRSPAAAPGRPAGHPHHPRPASIPSPSPSPSPLPVTSLPVAIYIRDACWVFEIDLDPRRLPAAPPSALPSEIVIGDTGDGLGDAAAAIASVLRTAGSSAAAVRFVGVIDDFIALSASGAYSGGALPRHARQPSPGRTGRHRAHA